LPCSVWVHWQL